jgi:hypothetical protein
MSEIDKRVAEIAKNILSRLAISRDHDSYDGDVIEVTKEIRAALAESAARQEGQSLEASLTINKRGQAEPVGAAPTPDPVAWRRWDEKLGWWIYYESNVLDDLQPLYASPAGYVSGLKKAMQICQDHPEARAAYIYECIRAEEIAAGAAPTPEPVPVGWVSVPAEPTEEMMEVGAKYLNDSGIAETDYPRYPMSGDTIFAAEIYKSMLAAAKEKS